MLNIVNLKEEKIKTRLLSARDMKKIFSGVSQATLAGWAKKGLFGRYKIGGLVFYKESEIMKLIENSREL